MKHYAIRVGAIAAIVAIGVLLFLWQRTGSDVQRHSSVASPVASSTPEMPPASVRLQPAQSSHFLPQLPPRQLVPRKPSILVAPPKSKTANPP